MPKKYLLYIHDELFDKEQNKSQLVNNLLERHYHGTVEGKSQDEINDELEIQIGLKPPPVARKPKAPALLNIPGVEIASQARCKGKHYMNRVNCGKPGCPWV